MKIAALAFAAACLLAFVSPHAIAAPSEAKTTVKAILVIASKTAGKADPRLAAYDETLRRVLRFESFRLVGQDSAEIAIPGSHDLTLGAGQRLELKTEAAATNRRVQVSWFEGKTAHMKTVLVLRPGVPAVLGGPAHGEGEVYAVILSAQ